LDSYEKSESADRIKNSDVWAQLGFRELGLDDFQAQALSLSPARLGLGSGLGRGFYSLRGNDDCM